MTVGNYLSVEQPMTRHDHHQSMNLTHPVSIITTTTDLDIAGDFDTLPVIDQLTQPMTPTREYVTDFDTENIH